MSMLSVFVLSLVGFSAVLVASTPTAHQGHYSQPIPVHVQPPPVGHYQPPLAPHQQPNQAQFTGNQPIVARPFPDGQQPPMRPILNNAIDDCVTDNVTSTTINPLPSTTSVAPSTTTGSSSGSSTPSGSSSTQWLATSPPEKTTSNPTTATLFPTLPTLPTIGTLGTLQTLIPTLATVTSPSIFGRKRRQAPSAATPTGQREKMQKVMKLVDMVKLQDCVARVICALNCSPDGYGPDGKKVFSMMLQVQTSGTVNETETRFYLNAAMNGRRYRENATCAKCNDTYCNCEATTRDLVDVVSLVNLDVN